MQLAVFRRVFLSPRTRGYAALVVGSGFARALSFVATVLLARMLAPSRFGEFTVYFTVLIAFSTATEFVDQTFVRFANVPDIADRRPFLAGAVRVKIGALALLVALAYPIALVLAHGVFGDPGFVTPVTLAILGGAGFGLVTFRAATYVARERYGASVTVTAALYAFLAVEVTIPFLAGWTLSLRTVYALYTGTCAALGVVALLQVVKATRPLHVPRAVRGRLWAFLRWVLPNNVLYVAFQRLDVILLVRYVDSRHIGYYGAAIRLTMVLSLLISSLSGFVLPRVARTRSSRDALHGFLREAALLSGVLAAAAVTGWLLAPTVIVHLLGPSYEQAIGIVRVLLLGLVCTAFAAPLTQLLLARDQPRHLLGQGIVKLVSIAGLTILLASRYGVIGAAWAATVTEAVALLYVALTALADWRASANWSIPASSEKTS
jgi:O-antigen/teichoic acid export membrane protein